MNKRSFLSRKPRGGFVLQAAAGGLSGACPQQGFVLLTLTCPIHVHVVDDPAAEPGSCVWAAGVLTSV